MPLIRARDLRANVKEHGYERGVMLTLEVMLEDMAEMRQHMRELAAMTAQCVDGMVLLNQVGDGMQRAIDRIKREQGREFDSEPS